MTESKSLLFICPFWGQTGHVGTIRAQRHVKWLTNEGFKICIVKAGLTDRVESKSFGELVTIKDPLSMFDDSLNDKPIRTGRKPNKLRRYLGYLFLLPDPTILWAKRVLKHHLVLSRASEFNWFMASSPSESAFIPASHLAKKFKGKFWMDLRDGWLDEPMKPLLIKSSIHRFRESRIERRMVNSANVITVTSENWKKLLQSRYPESTDKINVIPNTFEQNTTLASGFKSEPSNVKKFVYAGRIYSSRPERSLEILITSINQFIESHNYRINIEFIGFLSIEEEHEIAVWAEKLKYITFTRTPHVERQELLGTLSNVDGLLLVSESMGSIPAKFFDYAVSGRPVLGVTKVNSAFDLASRDFEWIKKIYIDFPEKAELQVSDFFKLTYNEFSGVKLPEEFTSDFVREKLIEIVQ